MSENEFLNALKEEMPEGFGHELLAQLKADDKKKKVLSFPTFWTVAVASIVTVLVGFMLFVSRVPNAVPLSLAMQAWQSREPLTPENINLIEPLLTIGDGQAEAIALSPDGNTLAVGTSKGVFLHNAHDLAAEPVALGLPPHVYFNAGYNTAFSYMEYIPDGRLFMLVRRPNALTLYQWSEAEGYLELYTLGQPWLLAQAVDVSPDGTMLLLGTCSMQYGMYGDYCQNEGMARLEIVDLANGGNVFSRMPRRMSNAIAAMNPDWTLLAYEEESKIRLYDLSSGETVDLLLMGNGNGDRRNINNQVMRSEEMHSLHFSPDGTKIGIIDASGLPMDWWELSALQEEALSVRQYGTSMYSDEPVPNRPDVALYPLADEYVTVTASGIMAYSYDGNVPFATFASETIAVSFEISADGQTLYTLDMSGLIRRWDWESQSLSETSTRYTTGSNWSFSISADSRLFTSGGYGASGLGYLYELSPSGVQQSYVGYNEFTEMDYSDTAISQDGRYVAFTENGALWVYDRNEQSRSRVNANSATRFLSFRSDGALLSFVRGGDYGTVDVYTAEMLETDAFPTSNVIEPIESVPLTNNLFSPDGTKLLVLHCADRDMFVSACNVSRLSIFDTFSWEEIAVLEIGNSAEEIFFNYSFSADSQWLFFSYCDAIILDEMRSCAGENYGLNIWNMADIVTNPAPRIHLEDLGEELQSIMGGIPYPDGSFLFASWGWEAFDESENEFLPNAIFWELEPDGSIREIRRMEMRYVSFAPDGTYFLTGRDGQIELWGVPGGVASGN
jgi:WD40 repeat protein